MPDDPFEVVVVAEEVEAAAPKKVIAAALTKQMDRVVSLCRPSPKDGA